MKICKEENLIKFDFWGGACDSVKYLTYEEVDIIDRILEECYPEGMTEMEVNGFFWFEKDTIAEWLGYSSFEELIINKENR